MLKRQRRTKKPNKREYVVTISNSCIYFPYFIQQAEMDAKKGGANASDKTTLRGTPVMPATTNEAGEPIMDSVVGELYGALKVRMMLCLCLQQAGLSLLLSFWQLVLYLLFPLMLSRERLLTFYFFPKKQQGGNFFKNRRNNSTYATKESQQPQQPQPPQQLPQLKPTPPRNPPPASTSSGKLPIPNANNNNAPVSPSRAAYHTNQGLPSPARSQPQQQQQEQ